VEQMKLLTAKEIAGLLRAKPSTVYAWAEQGILPCLKINGLLRFDEEEILGWLSACKRAEHCYNSDIQARARKGGIK